MLSPEQKDDLHGAIIEYCESSGFSTAAAALRTETGVGDLPCKGFGLERKWTSILRLQRKITELEATIAAMKDVSLAESRAARGVDAANPDFLPQLPAKQILKGHRKAITAIAIHPTYNIFASASEDATIRVWDLDTNSLERTLTGHTNAITSIAFNEDGSVLASGSNDTTIKLWSFNKLAQTAGIDTDSVLLMSPGGTQTRVSLRTLTGHDSTVSGVAFVPKHATLLSCSRDCTIGIWDIESGHCLKRLRDGHSDWIRQVRASLGIAVSCGDDYRIVVWDMSSARVKQTLTGHEHVIECLELSPAVFDSKMKAARSKESGTPARTPLKAALSPAVLKFATPTSATTSSATSTPPHHTTATELPSGGYALTGSRDRTMRLWDLGGGFEVCSLEAEGWVRDVKFHPNGTWLLSISEDNVLRVFDAVSKTLVRKLSPMHSPFLSVFDIRATKLLSQPLIVSGAIDAAVQVWDCR